MNYSLAILVTDLEEIRKQMEALRKELRTITAKPRKLSNIGIV